MKRIAVSVVAVLGLVGCTKEAAAPAAAAPAAAAPAPINVAPVEAPADNAGQCNPEKEANCEPATAATADPKAAPEAPAPVAAGPQHFGGAFALTETVPLSTVVGKPDEYTGKDIRVSATIAKVCKKKGCWFVLKGAPADTQTVRVTMKDYGFFVPTDSDGKVAVVEGNFKSVPLPESQRKHLAEDGGDDPTKVVGDTVELTLVATAIDITAP